MGDAMTAVLMATDRPTSAKDRKAHMEAVAARLEAEENARLQEHREACNLPVPIEPNEVAGEEISGAERASTEDSGALLEFEAEVAVTAGRHLVVAKTKAAKSELAMFDRAEELVSRLRDERDHLTTHLQRLKLSSRESDRDNPEGSAADAASQAVDDDAEAQSEVERMFEELVGNDPGTDDDDDDWLSLADASRVSAAMAAAVADSSDSSRPASGVSDPQPRSPPQGGAPARISPRVGTPTTPTLEPEPEPEPQPEPQPGPRQSEPCSVPDAAQASDQRRSAGAKRRPSGGKHQGARDKGERKGPKPRRAGAILGGGAKPSMDVGAYAAKRAAALAKSKELKVAVELGQRKTEARDVGDASSRRGVSDDSAEKAIQAEQARAAWLAKKKQQDRLKRQAEAEKKQAKQREEQDWQRQREERAAAVGRRTTRPNSRGSAGCLTPPTSTTTSTEGGEIKSSQSLPVLVPPSGTGTATGPRELLRQRRQRRQSQGDVGARSSADELDRKSNGTGASGRGRGNASRGVKTGRSGAGRRGTGRGSKAGSGRQTRPESASVRQRKTAASALEVEAATERIKTAVAQEVALRELLEFAMSDVEGIEELEKQAEARPQSPVEIDQAQEVAQDNTDRG